MHEAEWPPRAGLRNRTDFDEHDRDYRDDVADEEMPLDDQDTGELTSHEDNEPEVATFGLIDVVEAFTAMRHEYRGQTKESRALASTVEDAAEQLRALQSTLCEQIAAGDVDQTRRLIEAAAGIDSQLSRAVDVLTDFEQRRADRTDETIAAIRQRHGALGFFTRTFSKQLLAQTEEVLQKARDADSGESAIEGLRMVLAQLRQVMKQHKIVRHDVVGEAFDPERMNALGTIKSSDVPAGHVAEQVAAGYSWRGNMLSFAQVRVAQPNEN